MIEKQTELIKSYVAYNDIDTLLKRKQVIINTIKNTINRENTGSSEYNLSFKDSQILIDNDKFILMILINKEYK